MKMLMAVALGGAMGAVGRYLVIGQVGQWFGTGFPTGTIVVNVVGSFVMGLFIELMALTWSPSPELRALLTVGFLGAFTTFSTFSMDVALLTERSHLGQAAFYILVSVALSIAGLFAGMHLFRSLMI